MFKVKNIKTKEIVQVLEATTDEIYGTTFFLFGKIMDGDGVPLKIMFRQITRLRKVKFDFPQILYYNKRK